jgi:large subunit ribosomal protein L19
MDLIKIAEESFAGTKKEFPKFKSGDTVTLLIALSKETRNVFSNIAVL